MSALDALIADARELAAGNAHTPAEQEAARQLQICNACRYCEGFCAVFPAMTRRLEFNAADLHYMANLCHNCGACLHACQYAPPHDFGVNIPQSMARLRGQTYQNYAWPAPLGALYQRNGVVLVLVVCLMLSAFLWAGMRPLNTVRAAPDQVTFYDLFSHNTLVALFAPVFLYGVLALGMSLRRFLRAITPVTGEVPSHGVAQHEAARDALTLRYLDGGHGEGCHNEDDALALSRRRAHHLTFYGFALCFAATSVATLYHYVAGWPAPYDLPSLPKLLGVSGGVMLLVGAAWLLWLNLRRHALHGDAAQRPMDRAFIVLLMLISASGLALWLARGHTDMPLWLCIHLATVMALFVTLPYSKMAHGFYRGAALLRHAVEKRLPNPVTAGGDS